MKNLILMNYPIYAQILDANGVVMIIDVKYANWVIFYIKASVSLFVLKIILLIFLKEFVYL